MALKAISLFTGAGGLDIGFEAAGFRTQVAVEFDRGAVETLELNGRSQRWGVLSGDITALAEEAILAKGRLKRGEADTLIAGPPCQPFSRAGRWVRGETQGLADPRANTLTRLIDVIRVAQPRTFVIENVPDLRRRGGGDVLHFIDSALDEINAREGSKYRCEVAVLNAADFGVPQIRRRLFIVGSREGRPFSFPRPRYFDTSAAGPLIAVEPYRTAWDAIGDLEVDSDPSLRLTGQHASLLPSISPGQNYQQFSSKDGRKGLWGWRTRYWSFLQKLAKNRPSWTIQAQPGPSSGPFHWCNRRLSVRELCRLQTFPDDFMISGDLRAAQRQIGNAVPCALAEALARSISGQLLDTEAGAELTLVTGRRLPIPEEETPLALPDRWRRKMGAFEAHAGTGNGPGALKRTLSV